MKKLFCFMLSIFLILLTACKSGKNINSEKPTIAVAIPPIANIVESICGDTVNVITVLPAGASPESYEPSAKEISALQNAQIYFSLGLPMEENFIIPSLNNATEKIELYKEIAKKYPELTEGEHSHRDPHIWLSVKRMITATAEIEKAVSEIIPENADKYRENATKYTEKLEKTNEEITNLFAHKKNRQFIAFHPAFAYFADEYSLKMYALEEHGKEITAKRLAQMIDFARKENIKTIFYQTENSDKTPKSFAKEIGGKAYKLDPLAYDYPENIMVMAEAIAKAMK